MWREHIRGLIEPSPVCRKFRLVKRPFWSVGDAAARITRLPSGLPGVAELAVFLPEVAEAGSERPLHCRAAVTATFVARLELARGGALTLH